MTGNKKKNGYGEALQVALNVGMQMAATTLVGLGMGRLLDYWLDTGPWLTALFVFLGMVAGLWTTYRQVMKL